MDVSIVMINYNTFDLTKNAIESIIANTQNLKYEIILIDNASPDNSGDRLQNYFGKNIVYIQAGGNFGTAKSFNIGASRAAGQYILWLNTDILMKDNFVYELFDYMQKHPECGICGGNLVNEKNEPIHSFAALPSLKTVRREFNLFHILKNQLKHSEIKKQYNFTGKALEVGYITGADMMIRKSVIGTIGGFDEDIFMYAEESEFTYRMKKQTEYKVISVPDAVMQHLEGASFGDVVKFNERRFRTKLNGNCVYFEKCYGHRGLDKYLKLLKRSYFKLMILNMILFRKDKADECRLSRKVVEQKFREINAL